MVFIFDWISRLIGDLDYGCSSIRGEEQEGW